MKILIMGAGKMGSFFIDLLSFDHEVAAYEKDARRLRFTYNCQRFTALDEVENFQPELVINAVTVKYTIPAFEEVLPKTGTVNADTPMCLRIRCSVRPLPISTS